jgi:hypothetical protein
MHYDEAAPSFRHLFHHICQIQAFPSTVRYFVSQISDLVDTKYFLDYDMDNTGSQIIHESIFAERKEGDPHEPESEKHVHRDP